MIAVQRVDRKSRYSGRGVVGTCHSEHVRAFAAAVRESCGRTVQFEQRLAGPADRDVTRSRNVSTTSSSDRSHVQHCDHQTRLLHLIYSQLNISFDQIKG